MDHAGHVNHAQFWTILAPASGDGGKILNGTLKAAIERDFGSFEVFKGKFNNATLAIQGSGWGWLVSAFHPVVQILLKINLLRTGLQQGF